MKNTFFMLLCGWATVTVGLLLAIVAGHIAEEQFSITGDGRLIVQAVVMSLIVVPIILYFYNRLYKLMGQPTKPVYSLKRATTFLQAFSLRSDSPSLGYVFPVRLAGLALINGTHLSIGLEHSFSIC